MDKSAPPSVPSAARGGPARYAGGGLAPGSGGVAAPGQHDAPTEHDAPAEHDAAAAHDALAEQAAPTEHDAPAEHDTPADHDAPAAHDTSASVAAPDDAGAADYGLAREVGASARRKLHAAAHPAPGPLYGLGMMGLVGWAVAVPTLAGAALGWWLDNYHAGRHGWTLALLAAGLTLGCFNAWRWVAGEQSAINKEAHHDDT